MENTKKKYLMDIIGLEHIKPQRLWQHAQGFQGSAPHEVLELKGKVNPWPYPNPESISK